MAITKFKLLTQVIRKNIDIHHIYDKEIDVDYCWFGIGIQNQTINRYAKIYIIDIHDSAVNLLDVLGVDAMETEESEGQKRLSHQFHCVRLAAGRVWFVTNRNHADAVTALTKSQL